MKRKIFSILFNILFALVLVLSFSLVTAMPAAADYAAFDNTDYYYAVVKEAPAGTKYSSAGLSPDGTQIVAQMRWEDTTFRSEVVLMDADGTNEITISPNDSGTGDIPSYGPPFWSDDGTAIGFVERHTANPNKVISYDVASKTRTYIYEPTSGLPEFGVCNPDFLGDSKTSIVFWDWIEADSAADLFIWDGTTITNITNSTEYSEYEPVSNADGTVIVYWSGEKPAEPINTTHTLTQSGTTWTKDVDFTPIPDTYWASWSGRADNYIGLTIYSTKDVAVYDSTGVFVMDLTGPGYESGTGQWNFFGCAFEGPNGEFVMTSNARSSSTARDIVFANPRTALFVDDDGSDSNPGTEAAPFATVQKAIDEAAPDGTITVAAGMYSETVFIDQSLTLLGAKVGQDARTRDTASGESILDGTGLELDAGIGAFNIEDGVSNVVIDGFEICNWPASANPGNGSAVMAYSYGTATQGLSQITIQNNYMHDLGWNGVLVWSNNQVVQDDFTIQFNLIEEAPYAAIELTNVTNSQVLNNKVIAPTVIADDPGDAGVGIEIAVRAQPGITISAGNVLVEENEITGTFAEGSRAAINILSRTYASDSNATLTGVTVRNNTVSANVSAAILAVAESRDNGPATISNLQIVDGNTISGFSKSGIVVKDVSSVQIEGNTISTTDHSAATNGIQIGYLADGAPASTGTTGTVNNNQISDCHWSEYDPAQETYEDDWTASGILVIDTESALEISGNEVQSCDVGLDIETSSETIITNNDVHDNSYGFVLWNTNPTIRYNNIYQNALGGAYRTSQVPLGGILNATNNWWGHASGSVPPGTYESYGDSVSEGVDFEPWLLEEVVPGVEPTTYDKTLALKDGWTLISTDALADELNRAWQGTILAYKYTSAGFVDAALANLEPLTAIYVKTDGGGGVGFNHAEVAPAVYAKDLEAGWNLISIPSTIADTGAILSPLRYVTIGTQQGVGLSTLVSQEDYNQFSDSFYLATLTDADWDALLPLYPLDGYWAYMNAAKTFEVIPD